MFGVAVGTALGLVAVLAPACGGSSDGGLFGGSQDGGGGSDDGTRGGDACIPTSTTPCPVAHDGCAPACAGRACGATDGCGGVCTAACACGPATCTGCCTLGVCNAGTTRDACGGQGAACRGCPVGAACSGGLCVSGGPVDAGLSCAFPGDCQHAQDLAQISGDTAGTAATATGATSKWLALRVSETDQGVLGVPMTLSAVLTSPPGANFDLFLYIDDAGTPSARACGPTPQESSTNTAGDDSLTHSWGEGAVSNSQDDTRIVTLEVRHVSGPCAPGATWSLTVKGH